jgi:hypothetical protein
MWLLPLALFACPVHEPDGWQLILTLAIASVVIAYAAVFAVRRDAPAAG